MSYCHIMSGDAGLQQQCPGQPGDILRWLAEDRRPGLLRPGRLHLCGGQDQGAHQGQGDAGSLGVYIASK